ncbi:hypothetical protein V1512DRAFT_261259 [Lipomyces arxii]|uniref:uncharacterized protein n=1 Tax=Lipomyces arxii TaxID=56418 RepID=UPI0034CD33F0
MAVKYLHDPLSRFGLHLLKESLRPHLRTCLFPDFLQLPQVESQVGSSCGSFGQGSTCVPRIPIPLCWHFIYFPSIIDERELYSDGYDPVNSNISLNGHSRRRWKGGEISFGRKALVCEAPGVCELTESFNVTGEHDKQDEWDKVDEYSVRRMSNSGIESVVESRHLVYLQDTINSIFSRAVRPLHSPTLETSLIPTRALLFRFSALTFNAHRIHYDKSYATSVEQLPDVILQGALSLVLLMSWVQFDPVVVKLLDIGINSNGRRIESVRYSCVQNVIVDREIRLCIAPIKSSSIEKWRIWLEQDGGLCLKGTLTMSQG